MNIWINHSFNIFCRINTTISRCHDLGPLAIIESSQDGIEGKYGTNTAIRLTSPEGTKVTLWVNGYEEEHFNAFIEKLDKKGVSLPVKVDFLRTQEEAKTSGNKYNRIRFLEVASGEEVQMELDSL